MTIRWPFIFILSWWFASPHFLIRDIYIKNLLIVLYRTTNWRVFFFPNWSVVLSYSHVYNFVTLPMIGCLCLWGHANSKMWKSDRPGREGRTHRISKHGTWIKILDVSMRTRNKRDMLEVANWKDLQNVNKSSVTWFWDGHWCSWKANLVLFETADTSKGLVCSGRWLLSS